MEEPPVIPAEDGPEDGPEDAFGVGDRVLAAVLLVGAGVLGYVCLDVLAGGRITRVLSARPREIGE